MDFGHVDSLDGVSFDLPSFDERFAPPEPRAQSFVARIGAPAWSSRAYVGKLYPKGTKPGDYLARYAESYFAIELNATFHRYPDAKIIDGWCAATPSDFRFCPKVHKNVTEALEPEEGRRFADAVARFGARLGPLFLQLPPSVGPSALPRITAFLDAIPGVQIAVEVRSKGWFRAGRLIDAAFDAFASRGVGAVITDTAGRRDVCHQSLTAPFTFIRFQGNELHATDALRLDAWAERFALFRERGVKEAWLFTHQPDEVLCPETLAIFAERLDRRGIRAVPRNVPGTLFDRG